MKQINEAIDIIKIVAIWGDDIGKYECKQLRKAVKLLQEVIYEQTTRTSN